MNQSINAGIYRSYDKEKRSHEEDRLVSERRKQQGVSFPSAAKQEYVLIVRLDLKPKVQEKTELVRKGLRDLCSLFERINEGKVKIDTRDGNGDSARLGLETFCLSTTLGFGIGFFEKLGLQKNRPKKLRCMPSHEDLGDPARYVFTQTDMIIQICSAKDFVNRWIFKSDSYPLTTLDEKKQYHDRGPSKITNQGEIHDISTAINNWAFVEDLHSGFQRLDGRNLMGFVDGTSQPDRLSNNVIWTTRDDEDDALVNGTYMVFQKIEHDLELWEKLSVPDQEKWVGRSKGTGLLLGTLPKDEDEKLASECRSSDPVISKLANSKLKKLLKEQKDPYKQFFGSDPRYKNIQLACPVWSHVRKANPRGADGEKMSVIFRRGYLFMEDTVHPGRRPSSGLLFICFQRNIVEGFEYIKKIRLNNKNFPVPELRKNFTVEELAYRHMHGRFSKEELNRIGPGQKSNMRMDSSAYFEELGEVSCPQDLQNTGKEGLGGPSKLGVFPRGDLLATVSLGGGYYFIPPIPKGKISEIGQQFFQ